MQQRYYDLAIGRFLSTDPIPTDPESGANFNSYWYANNNPYRFTDPDGRASICPFPENCPTPEDEDTQIRSERNHSSGRAAAAIEQWQPIVAEGVEIVDEEATNPWNLLPFGLGRAKKLERLADSPPARVAERSIFQAFVALFRSPASNLSADIARTFRATGTVARNGKGQTFVLAGGKVTARVMQEGGGRTNYMRLSVAGPGSVDAAGNFSSDVARTHIPITDSSTQLVIRLVERYSQ